VIEFVWIYSFLVSNKLCGAFRGCVLTFQTIFEICGKNKSQEYQVMKQKRSFHKDKINTFHDTLEQKENEAKLLTNKSELTLPKSSSEDIDDAFDKVILPKKRKLEDLYKKNKRQKSRDDNFIPYLPADRHTEEGYEIRLISVELLVFVVFG
jgi:hypothetical protein